MSKIRFLLDTKGLNDVNFNKGDEVDLGDVRNDNAVNIGRAEWIEEKVKKTKNK